MQVVCAGHVNWDVTLLVDDLPAPDREAAIRRRTPSPGGSAANVAVGLAGLDVSVGLVGSDERGLLARRALATAGVDPGGLRTARGPTALKYLLVDGDGSVLVLGVDGRNEAVGPVDVDAGYVPRADHLHLTGHRPDTAARLAGIAAEAGLTVSFDPGRRVAERDGERVLANADLVFGTAAEAAALPEPDGTTIVVRTHGAGGAVAETPGERHSHPGYTVETADTAGAGDAFAAGFIASWLDTGDLDKALATANACGAPAAERPGTTVELDRSTVHTVRD